MTFGSREFKRLFWFITAPVLAAGLLLGLRQVSGLYSYFERARTVDSALNLVEPLKVESGRLSYLPDGDLVRPVEPLTRDQLTNDYLLAFEELTYSLYTGEQGGLDSYFQEGALADALLATGTSLRSQFIDWDHRVNIHFYAPDGGTLGLTDTYYYAQGVLTEGDLVDVRVAQRKLDVIVTLDNGAWRIHHWRTIQDEEVRFPETRFSGLAKEVKAIRGVNYTPRSAPFNAFWPNFNAAELDADFATASRLGFNTVRFFIPYPAPAGLRQNLPVLLETAERHEVQLIPTLLDGYTQYQLKDLPAVLAYLTSLEAELSHANVLLIDVKNEADSDFKTAGHTRTGAFLSYVLNTVRAQTGKPVTVGLIAPDPALLPYTDVVTLHHYGQPEALASRLAAAEALGKPVLLEEFGFHSWPLKLPDPHSQKEQAWYYDEILTIAADTGWLAWTLYDLPTGNMPGERRVERHLGILKADGSPKPVVSVLQGATAAPLGALDRLVKFRYLLLWVSILTSLMVVAVYRLRYRLRLAGAELKKTLTRDKPSRQQ